MCRKLFEEVEDGGSWFFLCDYWIVGFGFFIVEYWNEVFLFFKIVSELGLIEMIGVVLGVMKILKKKKGKEELL